MISRIRAVWAGGATLLLLTSIVTLFHARRFCAEVIAPPTMRAALWLMGIDLVVHQTARRTGDSVFLSPEGTRITCGQIGVFNKERIRDMFVGFLADCAQRNAAKV